MNSTGSQDPSASAGVSFTEPMQATVQEDPSPPASLAGSRAPSRRMTRFVLRLVVVAAVLVALVYFVASNFVIVEVRLFGLHQPARLAWVIVLSFLAGAVAGAATMVALRGRLLRR